MPLKASALFALPVALLAGLCFLAGCAENSTDTPASSGSGATQQSGETTPVAANTETVTLSVPGMT